MFDASHTRFDRRGEPDIQVGGATLALRAIRQRRNRTLVPPTLTPRSDGRSRQPKASRSPQCCTVIEFAGIPGSGKSTLAAALTRELAPVVPVSMPDRFEYRRKALSTKEKFRLDLRYAARSAGYRLRRLRYDIGRARPGFWVMRNGW